MAAAAPPVWSCDTHKRNRELKQQQLLLASLLTELRRATGYWFQAKRTAAPYPDKDCFQLLVQTCMKIVQHGFRLGPQLGGDALQRLIDDFEFLRLTEQMQHHTLASSTAGKTPPPRSVAEFVRNWVTRCLRTRCLSQCLQALVADKELLDCYYQADVAFLRQSRYATALIVCLTAIQLNQHSLLSQLDAQLLQPTHKQLLHHRRTNSQPNFSVLSRLHAVPEEQQQELSLHVPLAVKFRRVKSLPCLEAPMQPSCDEDARRRCQTFSSAAVSPRARSCYSAAASPCSLDELDMLPSTSACSRRSQLSTDSGTSSGGASGGDGSSASTTSSQVPATQNIQLINCDNIEIWTDQSSAAAATPTPAADMPQAREVTTHAPKRSSPLNNFLTNLFGSPPVYTSWYRSGVGAQDATTAAAADSVLDTFLPVNGKKLLQRGKQNLFEDAGVSMLDYNSSCRETLPTALPSTPLDILGGCAAAAAAAGQSSATSNSNSCSLSSESNSKLDNQSLAAFLQSSRYTHNNTDLEKENAHFRISEACITAIEHVKWTRQRGPGHWAREQQTIPSPMAQLPYAEQLNSDGTEAHTAEAVGLQLISKFNDQQLPKLSELKWLVSEEDAPQQLLPLPKPQAQQSGMTRGTKTWAPPRQQIIFTEHAPASRSKLLTRQNYRCAGCGMRVTKQLMQHFRYCTYLGKYMCTGCHRNQISAIPAKILQSWDFRCYPVSVFAYRLIEQMYAFPLFHVPDLHAELYSKHKALAMARKLRMQLQFVKDFIMTCRFASKEQIFFDAIPAHITNDADMWSMSDFVDVQNKSMIRSIEELIALSEQHVYNCVLCTGRAFVCEYCNNDKVIYPWQRKVQRCVLCGACAHQSCWKTKRGMCPRCARLNGRQQSLKS